MKKAKPLTVDDVPSLYEKVVAHLTFARMGVGGSLGPEDWKQTLLLAKKAIEAGL